MYKFFLLVVVLVSFFARLGVADTPADEFIIANEAEVLYGKGVHAFFDGDYKSALTIFGRVEYLASEDPRPYFFSALARYRLDNGSAEADKYFKKAAKLEWEGRAVREYNVSDALRRIQGKERLHIEQYRTQAKIEWQKAKSISDDIKYGQQTKNDKKIIADVAKGFAVTEQFGATSTDPYNSGKEEVKTTKKPENILEQILDAGNEIGGDATETIDVTAQEKNLGKSEPDPFDGTIQVEGQMSIEDEDVFAEFDEEPKQTEKTEIETPEQTTNPEPETTPETTTDPKPEDEPEPIIDPKPEDEEPEPIT
jgi:tetratricopeptide (TPR) repeat protein